MIKLDERNIIVYRDADDRLVLFGKPLSKNTAVEGIAWMMCFKDFEAERIKDLIGERFSGDKLQFINILKV